MSDSRIQVHVDATLTVSWQYASGDRRYAGDHVSSV